MPRTPPGGGPLAVSPGQRRVCHTVTDFAQSGSRTLTPTDGVSLSEAMTSPATSPTENAVDPSVAADDRQARRTALTLSFAQALFGVATMTVMALGGLVGQMLSPDPGLATLPVSLMLVGVAISTAPASLLMQRYGRRPGFITGALLGATGGALACAAVLAGDFWLFCLGTHCIGYFMASAGYYRFAAADNASASFRPKAISWVLFGGLAAAIAGPWLILAADDLMAPVPFAGAFAMVSVMCLLTVAVVATVTDRAMAAPRSAQSVTDLDPASAARPLREILAQPRLIGAIGSGMVSYGMMSLVMTATPIAMFACNHGTDASTATIGWHVVAMYAPSLFTGQLVARFGRNAIIAVGLALLVGCAVVALSGITLAHFTVALVLLGLGWNFAYIGSTTLVTDCHRPSERGKVQAVNDTCVFCFTAFTSLMSGQLLAGVGGEGVNLAVFPAVALAVVLLTLLPRLARRPRHAA